MNLRIIRTNQQIFFIAMLMGRETLTALLSMLLRAISRKNVVAPLSSGRGYMSRALLMGMGYRYQSSPVRTGSAAPQAGVANQSVRDESAAAPPEELGAKLGKRKTTDVVSGEYATKRNLLDFLFKKLRTGGEPCNNTDDVMEMIQQLLLEEQIPSDLIPQPEKRMSLSMEKQGLYPSWVEELAPYVFRLLTAWSKSNENK